MANGDQYFDKVSLALSFESGFTDESMSKKTVVQNGAPSIATDQFKFGAASLHLTGTDSISFPHNDDMSIYGQDFTAELWFKSSSTTMFLMNKSGLSGSYLPNWSLSISDGKLRLVVGNGYSALYLNIAGATNYNAGSWNHVALSKSGITFRAFLNGVLEVSGDYSGVSDDRKGAMFIGSEDGYTGTKDVYIDCVRITNGVGRYTANFNAEALLFNFYKALLSGTVKDASGNFAQRIVRAHRRNTGALVGETLSNPTTGEFSIKTADTTRHYVVVHDDDSWVTYLPFDGANNSTTFTEWGGKTVTPTGGVKISTAQSKFGGSSANFDGSGYLSIEDGGEFLFSGDFTIEFWGYGDLASRALFSNSANTYVYGELRIGNTLVVGSLALDTGATWKHVAIVRSGSTITVYQNGVSIGSATFAAACDFRNMHLGRYVAADNAGTRFIGYLDDFRICKGVAKYTGAFTPPAAALIQSSQLHNAVIYDLLTPA